MFAKLGLMPGMRMNRLTGQLRRVVAWTPNLLGPWPIRPIEFGLAAFFLNQYAETRVAHSADLTIQQGWTQGLPWSITVATSVALAFWLLKILLTNLSRSGSQRVWYLVGLVFTIALLIGGLYLLKNRNFEDALSEFPRVFLAILFLNAVLGFTEQRLLAQVRLAETALAESEKHRNLLLEVDEAARRSVADFLHDTVQGRLVVAAMQLRQTLSTVQEPQASELRSVVEELEEIRKNEVRLASRNLSPDITALGLHGALKELASIYRNQINVQISIDLGQVPRVPDLELGIYRIVEQALLNAAIHGQATTSQIKVLVEQQNQVEIIIGNDGNALARDFVKGSGSAVIDAWVHRFAGSWSLVNHQPTGVELRATLKIS